MRRMTGIKQQTLLVALIPIWVTILLFGSYAIYTRFSDADHALIEHSKSMTHQLALASEYALFSGNIELLEQGVNAQLQNKEVKSVQIFDADENPLKSKHIENNIPSPLSGRVNADSPVFEDSSTLVLYEAVFATPLILNDPLEKLDADQTKKLGSVIIEFNKSDLNSQKFEMLLINFIAMAGVMFISVLAALWLSRRISDPVINIGDIIKEIGSGNLIARIPPQTTVFELNELAHSINDMAQQLEDDRNTLEQRILNATQDLRTKKEEAEHAHSEVLNLNEKLSFALTELESKEHAKTRFLAAAGHDLRQPIAAANLFVESLKYCSPNTRQSELIEKLDQSMNVFSVMLERLLDISKLDAGLIKPQIKSIDLMDLFEWLEQTFAQAATDKKLRFRLFYPIRTTLIIKADIGLLQSILMNLVTNAIKFTRQGSILVSVRMRGDKVLMQVWDTGIGIAKHELAHIFDEFYQVGNQHRSREGGMGLGLSICQRAISLLGSHIACRSVPGRGSVFQFSLPLDGEQHEVEWLPVDTQPDTASIEMLFRNKHVVVIEDDALVSAGMVNLLQGMGAGVRYFSNAEDALKHTAVTDADYFVVDYALGGELTGLEFLEAMQHKREMPFRAVVITGETSSQFIGSVVNSRWPVLHKPVNYIKLATALG